MTILFSDDKNTFRDTRLGLTQRLALLCGNLPDDQKAVVQAAIDEISTLLKVHDELNEEVMELEERVSVLRFELETLKAQQLPYGLPNEGKPLKHVFNYEAPPAQADKATAEFIARHKPKAPAKKARK